MRSGDVKRWLRSATAIFLKDLHSELRTRYAVSALVMFVVITVAMIMFSLGQEDAPPEVLSGMLWVVIFFGAMSGLSRTFVMEEERGTSMTLQLLAPPSAVFFGKLLFNVVLILALNIFTVLLYLILVNGFVIRSTEVFVLTILLGSCGFASAATIIAAIVARANTRGTLYPVLAFPILLPLLISVIDATRSAADGVSLGESGNVFQFLISYIIVLTALSSLLFEYIWKD
jgi:heme exporter protein B